MTTVYLLLANDAAAAFETRTSPMTEKRKHTGLVTNGHSYVPGKMQLLFLTHQRQTFVKTQMMPKN